MTALEYPAVLGEMCVVIIWMEVWMNARSYVSTSISTGFFFLCQSSFAWQRVPAGNVYTAKVKIYIDFY
jgi:hypothetical protein